MNVDHNRHATQLFAPLASNYDRWSRWLSFDQDARWRRSMVAEMHLTAGMRVLDVAAGTGQVAELLRARGCHVVALDQSREMLEGAAAKGFPSVLAGAESLPFVDDAFDALTFTYLLRYVIDPQQCMSELVRVVRPGGMVGMVEFGLPTGVWRPLWELYTRVGLPLVGAAISPGWKAVGTFLNPSISAFNRKYPEDALIDLWRSSGLVNVGRKTMSLGGGFAMWGRRP